MSRTTTALKRLGVPGVAAVTMVAGLPLFLGTASAAHIQSLTLTPESTNEAAGVCVPYTVQFNFSTNEAPRAETVDVELTEGGSATAQGGQDVTFCTAPTNGVTPASPQGATASGSTDRAEFVTDATGKVTFGIVSNVASTDNVLIRAFYEVDGSANENNRFDANEFTDTATAQFTAGGPAGSNENQDAAEFVEVVDSSATATSTITRSDDTDTAVEGEARTYRVAVRNGAGDRLAGVQVSFTVNSTVDSADRAAANFAVTDNDGFATGTITFPERTGTGSDTVTFFVNQTGLTSGPGFDPVNEPSDTLVVAITDNANQQGRTVTLTALDDNGNAVNSEAGDNATNSARDGNRTFRAVVDGADTVANTNNTLLAFGVAGGSGDETVTPTECATADNASTGGTNTNDSFCDVVVNDPTPVIGQVLTVTVTIRGSSAADTATLTFRNSPSDARFVDFTEETVTVAFNTARTLTARVTDVDGNPVAGVNVRFTETGAGAFRNGSSTANATTDANGIATVETLSLPGEQGTQTVTADIRVNADGSTQSNQSTQAANAGTDPQGNALNATTNTGAAGRPTDTVTVTFTTPAPSPSATNTATTPPTTTPPTSGTPANCTQTPTVVLERSTIIATGRVNYRVTGAPANSQVQIFAYSRPSTTYVKVRDVTIGADGNGPGGDGFTPPTNTRLYAQVVGCDTDESRFSVVINVRTQISLNVVRNGTKNYTFSGRLLPARPGGLIASLYRVTNDGRQILTAQTRANASDGRYVINRRFTGTGRFGFVVRTGQDLQNAPGSSNVRSLLVF